MFDQIAGQGWCTPSFRDHVAKLNRLDDTHVVVIISIDFTYEKLNDEAGSREDPKQDYKFFLIDSLRTCIPPSLVCKSPRNRQDLLSLEDSNPELS